MLRSAPARRLAAAGLRAALAALLLAGLASECLAIEMFTFFGDGSRIGLPNLEVPVEAYPGIPLRSDRIRARRRAQRQPAPAPARTGQLPAGVTLRAMPAPRPAPVPRQIPAGPQSATATARGRAVPARPVAPSPAKPVAPSPVAPSPADVLPPLGAAD